jgi:FdhD protein
MMATPADLTDYAYGFSFTEGIIQHPDEIIYSQIKDVPKGTLALLEITAKAFHRLETYNRTLAGRTGCGLCGVERLDQAVRPLKKVDSELRIGADVIHQSMMEIKSVQKLNSKTGALHAAAFVNKEGKIVAIREDIGRHNALDKLIGHLLREKILANEGYVLITSRCSFEMVQKCAIAGIPLIAAVSATTDLAIKLAKEASITLITFTRKEGLNIVVDPQSRVL